MALFRMASKGSPYMRLILLIAGLMVALGGMQYLRNYAQIRAGANLPAPDAQQYDYADPIAKNAGGAFAGIEAEAQLYPTVTEDVLRLEREKGAGVVGNLQDPLLKLMRWLKGREPGWLERSVSRNVWHYLNAVREPSRWRFQSLHVYGMFATEDVIDFPGNPPGLQKLYLVTLFDQFDQAFFTVLTPQLPVGRELLTEGAPGRQGRRGSNLAGDAVFLMSFPFYTNAGVRDTPLFFAPRLWLAEEPRALPPLLDEQAGLPVPGEGANAPKQSVPGLDIAYLRSKVYNPPKSGDGARDYIRIASDLRSEKGALTHIYEYLSGMNPEQLATLAKNPDVNYLALMEGDNAPQGMFGAATSVDGVAISVETLRFPGASDGIDRIYLLTVGDLHYKDIADFTWVIATLSLPEGLRQGERVRAEGIFLKLYPYPTRTGQWHWSPLLVSKKVDRAPAAVSPFLPRWMTQELYIAALILTVLVLLFVMWRMWHSARLDTQKLEAIRLRTITRQKANALTGHCKAGQAGTSGVAAAHAEHTVAATDNGKSQTAPDEPDLLGRALRDDSFKS